MNVGLPKSSLGKLMHETNLLSDHRIKELIKNDTLRIEPLDSSQIGPTSIDLRLGSILVKYQPQIIKFGTDKLQSQEIDINDSGYTLKPGEFVLGMTKEKVYMPNGYQGVIETKGNVARAGLCVKGNDAHTNPGLQVHNNDGHIDPGFYGHITLELINMHQDNVFIDLVPDVPICQLFIGLLSEKCDSVYRGKYLNQEKPTVYQP